MAVPKKSVAAKETGQEKAKSPPEFTKAQELAALTELVTRDDVLRLKPDPDGLRVVGGQQRGKDAIGLHPARAEGVRVDENEGRVPYVRYQQDL